MLHGVDVSGHQPDWAPANNDSFVFVKATEGSTYLSERSAWQLQRARAKGLQIGHYHFLWPGNAKGQAAWFVAKADIHPGDLLVCDWENTSGGHPSVEDAAEFIAEVKRLKPANRVGLYCNRSDWVNTAVKAGDFLWIAEWGVDKPDTAAAWKFWQYSDNPIDQNWAASSFGTLAELKAWAKGIRWSDEWGSPYVAFGGVSKWVTPIDKTVLVACAQAAGWGSVRIVQGGLRPRTDSSASTHVGLGVGDIAIDARTKAQVWEFCAHLARSGFVPFPRGYGGDPWENDKHIHFGSRESYDHAHDQLQAQIDNYLDHWGNGLKNDGPYVGPRPQRGRWKDSPYNPVNIKADTGVYVVNTDVLNGRSVDEKIVSKRERGYRIQAAQQVYRWGRWNVVTATPTYYALQYLKPA